MQLEGENAFLQGEGYVKLSLMVSEEPFQVYRRSLEVKSGSVSEYKLVISCWDHIFINTPKHTV